MMKHGMHFVWHGLLFELLIHSITGLLLFFLLNIKPLAAVGIKCDLSGVALPIVDGRGLRSVCVVNDNSFTGLWIVSDVGVEVITEPFIQLIFLPCCP